MGVGKALSSVIVSSLPSANIANYLILLGHANILPTDAQSRSFRGGSTPCLRITSAAYPSRTQEPPQPHFPAERRKHCCQTAVDLGLWTWCAVIPSHSAPTLSLSIKESTSGGVGQRGCPSRPSQENLLAELIVFCLQHACQ